MITTAEKRGRLEDAWDQTQDAQSLREVLRGLEKSYRQSIAGGSLSSVGANGRSSAFSLYGPGQLTPLEVPELYRQLVDDFDRTLRFLSLFASLGLDPIITPSCGPLPTATVAQPWVLIDSTNYWPGLCQQFSIPTDTIVGKPITDSTVFLWMMDNLVAITEAASDYSLLRIGTGMQWV